MSDELKVGDAVVLAGEGPTMTVIAPVVGTGARRSVLVAWFRTDGSMASETLPVDALRFGRALSGEGLE